MSLFSESKLIREISLVKSEIVFTPGESELVTFFHLESSTSQE